MKGCHKAVFFRLKESFGGKVKCLVQVLDDKKQIRYS